MSPLPAVGRRGVLAGGALALALVLALAVGCGATATPAVVVRVPVLRAPASSVPPAAFAAAYAAARPSRVDALARAARGRWDQEQYGSAVHVLLRRVSGDRRLGQLLRAGNLPAVRTYVRRTFGAVWYHWHVSRLRLLQGRQVIVDVGVPFVVAPSQVRLRSSRRLAPLILQISDQDVIGFVRFMRRNLHVDVVARGRGRAHVSTLLPAALRVRLPDRGFARIAGRRYAVRSFTKRSLDREPVKVWVLVPA